MGLLSLTESQAPASAYRASTTAPAVAEFDRARWVSGLVDKAASAAMFAYVGGARQASRSFEAAETPAWTESWSTHANPINWQLSQQLPTLRSRSVNLGRNNEWATTYLLQLGDNVLGPTGVRLQVQVKDGSGKLDIETNKALELAYATWATRGNCETTGRRSLQETELLLLRTLAVKGEILYRIRPGSGPFGWRIQILDPDLLDIALWRDWQGRRVRMGVEITDDGEPVAYWLLMAKSGDAPSQYITVGRHTRIPAAEIRHFFVEEEVGQVRGVPWLTVGARRLWMLGDFEQAAAVASSNAAKRQGFFFSPTGEAPPGFADTVVSSALAAAQAEGRTLTDAELQQIQAAAQKYSTTVPGQFDTLPLGYQFSQFESKWPDVNASEYVKGHIRGFAAARGVSYVSLGNDLEAVNYSSAQVGIVGEREHYKQLQALFVGWFHAEIWPLLVPALVLRTPSLHMSRIDEYRAAASWVGRRWAPLDPVKAANANDTNLRLRLTSRRRIQLAAGDDPDEIAAEIAAEESIYGALDASGRPAADAAPASNQNDSQAKA